MKTIPTRAFLNLFKAGKRVTFKVYPQQDPKSVYEVSAKEGSNLLDALNESSIKDLSVFGICNKQLACHSCRVHIKQPHYSKLYKPSEDEIDVLLELGSKCRPKETRMSCQIIVTEAELGGATIEIPNSAFALFEDEDQ